MNNESKIDCIEMKNRVQAELLREYAGLTPEEERKKRQHKLSTGDSPAAKMWQSALKRRANIS